MSCLRELRLSPTARRLASNEGFSLIELLVALLILFIAVGMGTQLFISNLSSTNVIRQRMQMLDYADFAKGWLNANLATADVPPVAGSDWDELKVTAPDNTCYLLTLNASTNELEVRQASPASGDPCADVQNATPIVLAQYLENTASNPLFVYYDKEGNEVTDLVNNISSVRQVDVQLRLDNLDDPTPPLTRTYSYALGGVYRDNEVCANGGSGCIGTADLVDGSVTNAKIAIGALTGDKFQDGSIGALKLTQGARSSTFRLPLIANSDAVWSVTGSWSTGPNDAYQRTGVALGDYCASGKTLQARGAFSLYNRATPAQALSLRLRLVRDDGQGGAQSEFAASAVPGSANVPASGYALITTPWQTVDCGTPDTTTRFYSVQALASESGSESKDFSVVQAALELRYQ